MSQKTLIFILLVLFLANLAHAGNYYEAYNGIRSLGMGGANVAVVNDETSLITNPAALGKLRSSYLTIIDPEIHTNGLVKGIMEDNKYNPLKIPYKPQDMLDTLKQHPDKHSYSSLYLFPSFVVPNFGFGLLGSYSYDAQYSSAANEMSLQYHNDYSLLIGYNFKFFDGIVKLGFNAKYINRVEAKEDHIAGGSSGLSWDSIVNEGSGFASDVGLILTAPVFYLPTLAAVWHDVGDTSYSHAGFFYDGRPRPESSKSSIDVGISISPILGKYGRMQITAEVKGVNTLSQEPDKAKRYHAGLEFNIYDKLFIRGGWNQRYWTAGLEIAAVNTQFQLASWGEEVGTPTNHQEDRRYGFKFAFRF